VLVRVIDYDKYTKFYEKGSCTHNALVVGALVKRFTESLLKKEICSLRICCLCVP